MANTKITNPELFNLGDSTSATQLPVMTTAQRIAMNAPPSLTVDYLVVAGGAGGGIGGGGAGGYRTSYAGSGSERSGGDSNVENALTLQTETSCTVTVGNGGAGGFNGSSQPSPSGSNSVFLTITSTGGGGGGTGATAGNHNAGVSGGSGGGSHNNYAAGVAVTNPVQGFNGGIGGGAGGGGGGALSAGSVDSSNSGGNGGLGAYSSITGTSIGRAGGGGGFNTGTASEGGGNAAQTNGANATPNTGGGGGGAINGGTGGSGIVILRYATSDVASYTTTGISPTETTDGTDTILSFTTVGTGTITFTSSTPTGTISTGEMIFNSTTDKVEYWDGTKWYGITNVTQELSSTDPFGDGSQTALYKFAGNGSNENGTYTANVTASYVTGILGGGVSFGGSSSSLVTSLQPLSLGQSKTLWINFDLINFNADKQFYFAGGSTSSYNFWNLSLYYQHSTGLFYLGQQIRNATNSYWYTGTGYTLNNVSKTDWNLIYVSYSAGNFTYSINNSTIATNPKAISMGTISSMSANHEFGRIYSNGTPYYTAPGTKISSMRQFNRDLVGSEIQQIYDQVY